MYKFQQVLRTNTTLVSENGTAIEPDTRVVIMSVNEEARTARVKVEDPSFPDLRKFRVVAGFDQLATTRRGAPAGPRATATSEA